MFLKTLALASCSISVLPLSAFADVTIEEKAGIEYVKEWENVSDSEVSAISGMTKDLVGKIDADAAKGSKRVLRDAHPKAHGCVVAKFTVDAALPANYQSSVLQPGKSYDAIIRFSSAAATPQSDAVGDARGMAVKLLGVPGKKLLEGQESELTQDFVMINFPIFVGHDAADFSQLVSSLIHDGAPIKYFFPSLNPMTWRVKQALNLLDFNGKKDASLLQQRFFSLVPYLLNDQSTKFGAEPCSNNTALRPDKPDENFLRKELVGFLQSKSGCFNFVVQDYKPGFEIEDGMGWWPAGLDAAVEPPSLRIVSPGNKPVSKFNRVAQITIPPQSFDTDAKNIYCDNLSFQPWHAVPEHRPLGSINRARRLIYLAISKHRHSVNGADAVEPTSLREFQELK